MNRSVHRRSRLPRAGWVVFYGIVAVVVFVACGSTDDPVSTPSATPTSTVELAELIPTPAELPNNFLMQGVEDLTVGVYAETWPDPLQAALQLRDEWAYQEAVRRVAWRNPAIPVSDDDKLTQMTTVGVRYATHEDARTASEAHLRAVVDAEGSVLNPVEINSIGDLALAATGTTTINGRHYEIALVWVVDGPVVIEYSAAAELPDPLQEVLKIATDVNARF